MTPPITPRAVHAFNVRHQQHLKRLKDVLTKRKKDKGEWLWLRDLLKAR